jgi:phosphogluconate dehydratase
VSLSHDMFDAALMLGVCDKIVPGLLIGALSFGHLPVIFVPAGPMPSGLPNKEKAAVRQLYAEGQGHARGTAGSRSGVLPRRRHLHLLRHRQFQPDADGSDGPAHAGQRLRQSRHAAARRADRGRHRARCASPRWATTIARSAAPSTRRRSSTRWSGSPPPAAPPTITPLLARVYPNGSADVNHFQAAGGLGLVINELLDAGLLHGDIACVHGGDLRQQATQPWLDDLSLRWRTAPATSLDENVVRGVAAPFDSEGGLRCLQGNLGRAVVKISAVAPELRRIEAPARIFESQDALLAAFKVGALDRNEGFAGDFVAVVRGQGPRANGMPELHKLTPTLAALQDRGQRVALLTDGRMSGASGKVLAAIHVTPEAADAGPLAKLRDGDLVRIDGDAGTMEALVDAGAWAAREAVRPALAGNHVGHGRELFAMMRKQVGSAEQGACALFLDEYVLDEDDGMPA